MERIIFYPYKLIDLRKAKRLTQEELAKAVGINRCTLAKWEIGHCVPSTISMYKLSVFFNVSVGYLLGQDS